MSLRHVVLHTMGPRISNGNRPTLHGSILSPPALDIAQHPTDQRSRQHLLLSDKARGRRIDQGWEYFDDANANAAQLPPQCHLKGMEPGLGRGIGHIPR